MGKIIYDNYTLEGRFKYGKLLVGDVDNNGNGHGKSITTDNNCHEGDLIDCDLHGKGKITFGYG